MEKAILFLGYTLFGQSVFGSVGMIVSAYQGSLFGIISMLLMTIGTGAYLIWLMTLAIASAQVNKKSMYSHVGVNVVSTLTGKRITSRAMTNEPHTFGHSIPQKGRGTSLHDSFDFSRK